MHQMNIHEAKTQFSKLIALVESGEEVVVARDGRPVARIVPIISNKVQRRPGTAKGQFEVPDAFFDPLPEEWLEAFGP